MRLLQKMKKEINHEITAILLLSFAALSGISIYVVDSGLAFSSSQLVGILGLAISKVITSSVGQAKYVVPVLFVVYALMLLKNKPAVFSKKSLGLSIVFISLTTMLHLTVTSSKESFRHVFTEAIAGEGGGLIGAFFSYILISIVGIYGTFIVLGAAIIISFMLLTNTKFMEILSYVLFYLGRIYHSSKDFMNRFLFTTSEKPKKNL